MKKKIIQLFVWSWIISLPLALIGGYWLYNTMDRFNEYSVRYYNGKMSLGLVAKYELTQLIQEARVALTNLAGNQKTSLKKIHLVVPEPNLARLEEHMPQSGFEYVKGGVVINGKLSKAQYRYRGDTYYRWAWKKKSSRIKTSKDRLFEGLRSINFLAPRSNEQLNNYFSYKLAKIMGLIAPKSDLVRLYINGEDHGVHTLVEQIKEMTLRNSLLMPGDIYRGDMIGRGRYVGSGIKSLFDSASAWDKVAVNNHYAEDSYLPLRVLISLLNHPDPDHRQQKLSELLDMEAWGRYALFETLTQSSHADQLHNWRIYYDPWRQKLIPIVWDTMGWYDQLRGKSFQLDPLPSALMWALFENGDFLRARHDAFKTFFDSGLDKQFLALVKDTTSTMEQEVKNDPLLLPQDPKLVTESMHRLKDAISADLERVRSQLFSPHQPSDAEVAYDGEKTLSLLVKGQVPVDGIELVYNQRLGLMPQVLVTISTGRGIQSIDISNDLSVRGDTLLLDALFLPETEVIRTSSKKAYIRRAPGYYQIKIDGLPPGSSLKKISVGKGGKMQKIQPVIAETISPARFNTLKMPIAPAPTAASVWSGVVTIEGTQTLEGNLLIQPGTEIKMGEEATLIIKGNLIAEGTSELPIRFLPITTEQQPWGAVVLKGEGANGSVFSHCQMGGGSGLKGELFEYSGMLSIHDVKGLSISNCRFYDNHRVDDMVHTVYSELSFDNVTFENAVSDALDLDVSSATINNSRFINSGNDAVDLMTTQATILNTLFAQNGDKGISVGEGSHLVGINNQISNNEIGVQSKDRSTALLFNHTFMDNQIALHAYRKNWRYGGGGTIFLSKSLIRKNNKPSSAEKQSSLYLFDSAIEGELPSGKRVELEAIENDNKVKATEGNYFPGGNKLNGEVQRLLLQIPQEVAQQINSKTRGANGGVD